MRLVRFILFIFIVVIGIYFLFNFIRGLTSKNLSEISFSSSNQSANETRSLKEAIEKSLQDSEGTYALVVKNLKTGENYSLSEHKIFEAGSLYKMWVMVTVVNKIQKGDLKEDEVLSADIANLNNKFSIDPKKAEQTEGTISLTVNSALTQMITISHNYAALLLSEKVRLSTVANFLKENGFDESKVETEEGVSTTTAYEISNFLEKLYKKELANEQYSQKMIDLLKGQKLNNKLPKYLPKEITVAHKTGEIGWFSHDGGIVYTPKGDYIIVVLSESNSPSGAQDRIAQISKAVYDYFQRSSY